MSNFCVEAEKSNKPPKVAEMPPVQQAPPRSFFSRFRMGGAEKEREKEEAKTAEHKEVSRLSRIVQKLSLEEYLFNRRMLLQDKKWEKLQKECGEEILRLEIHTHTCGSKTRDYVGSPDGIFTLERKLAKGEEIPRYTTLMKLMEVDGAYVDNHDEEQFDILNTMLADLNANEKNVSFFGGTEVTSLEGHFIVLERENPVTDVPPAKTPAVYIARWAFINGYDVLIPHPNPSRGDPKRLAESAFGVDIGIEKETVEEILKLADKYDKVIRVASSNGTTTADYKARLLGNRNHWWQFWRMKRVPKEIEELYAKRVFWVAESDGHIKCEYPAGMLYVKKSAVVGPDGKVSAVKLSEAIRKQKELEYAAWKEDRELKPSESVVFSYNADSNFGIRETLALGPYSIKEYSRLIYVWIVAVLTGRAKQYAAAPTSTVKSQYGAMQDYETSGEE